MHDSVAGEEEGLISVPETWSLVSANHFAQHLYKQDALKSHSSHSLIRQALPRLIFQPNFVVSYSVTVEYHSLSTSTCLPFRLASFRLKFLLSHSLNVLLWRMDFGIVAQFLETTLSPLTRRQTHVCIDREANIRVAEALLIPVSGLKPYTL